MGRRIITGCLIAAFLGLLAAWLYADANYEYTVYRCYETDEIVEIYEDRLAGRRVECVPIYEPDNPAWVGVIRRITPFSLFLLGLAILYMFTPVIEGKLWHRGSTHLPRIP